jgi:alanine racemase
MHKPTRPTHVEVNLSRLAANYAAIRARVGRAVEPLDGAGPPKVMAVVKANAYGHGLVEVAQLMVAQGADYLGVAFLEEGMVLREQGVSAPILCFGSVAVDHIEGFIERDITLTAASVDKLRSIDEAAAAMKMRAKVHLKIDTGMERVGVHHYSAGSLLEASLRCRHCDIEGIYSHFANADAADLSDARRQLARFHEVLEFYPRHGLRPPLRHIANSAGVLQLPESWLDMVRPGILLYGVYPSQEALRSVVVQPALEWKSQVSYFKVVQPDHPVGYGSTWRSDHAVRVATVPVGYGDGYFRAISGKGSVLIRGHRHPIAGRVCMDQLMVNLEWGTAYNGDSVTLIGHDGDEVISADEVAGWAGTIPYEVLTNINSRVPRVYLADAGVAPP